MAMLEQLATMTLDELALQTPVRLPMTATVGEAVERMKRAGRDAVLVESAEGALVGIFTDRDLAARVDLDGSEWRHRLVSEAMTRAPYTSRADAPLGAAIATMRRHRCRHLPVIDAAGAVLGVLSIRDVVVHLAELFPEEFINLPPDPQHEASGRWGG
jgi:CBS domain-containing protein